MLKNGNNPCVNNRNFSLFLPNSIFSFTNFSKVQAHYPFWIIADIIVLLQCRIFLKNDVILMSYKIVILLSFYYLHNSIQEWMNYTRKQGHATHNLYDFLHVVVVDRIIATQKCPHHNNQNLWIFTLHGKRGSECVIKLRAQIWGII